METSLTSTLSGTERQEQILQQVERQQRISVAQICERFSVSEATARRDLDVLVEQGKVQRVHGGAIAIHQAPPELPILQRSADQLDEKHAIGAAAAQLVHDGETIFLGSGSTVLELARSLRQRTGLTVITNSLPVINALADVREITLVSLGGLFRTSELSFIGHITEQSLSQLRADRVFIGIHAIDVEQGLTNAYIPETMTDRAILKIGREVVVLADHSKCARISTALVAPISGIHTLVTDQQTPRAFTEALETQGIRVIVA